PVGRPLTAAEQELVATKTQELRVELAGFRRAFAALRDLLDKVPPVLTDSDVAIREAAVQTLMHIGSARGRLRQRITSLPNYGDSDPLALFAAADPLTSFLKRDLLLVGDLLAEANVRLRKPAMIFVLLLEEDLALPLADRVIANLSHPDRTIRWAAAKSLGNVKSSDRIAAAVPGLAKLLSDTDLGLRTVAAQTLEKMGPTAKAAAPALAQAVMIGDGECRKAAIRALLALGPEAAAQGVPNLIEVLGQRDVDAKVIGDVCDALARIGTPARAAIPSLRQLLNHEDTEVRAAASEALLAINSGEK
ncbi:MAG: HEAT repeat domain-containing protein, partial [Gemmataceae bacterium]|nr:HEAT repeat domain-containing protein [Gemmataceae bacterium]